MSMHMGSTDFSEKVFTVASTVIRPVKATPHPEFVDAALFDHICLNLDNYVPILLFYRLSNTDVAYKRLIHQLQDSLSKVLVPYYPMAGRWVEFNNAYTVRRLMCNDDGVPFIEAEAHCELEATIGTDTFVPTCQLSGFEDVALNPTSYNQDIRLSLPSLIVKVTRFRCGGVVLGVNFNHVTADGEAMMQFLQAWSETSLTGSTSKKPVHDRSNALSLIDLQRQRSPTSTLEIEQVQTLDTMFHEDGQKLQSGKSDSETFKVKKPAPFCVKFLNVKTDRIESFRLEASKASKSSKRLSRVDCIIAHFWRCLSKLPVSMLENEDSIKVWTAVECRRRLSNPPLPEQYFGNCVLLVPLPELPVKRIASESHAFAGSLVQKTVQNINSTTCWDAVDEMVSITRGTATSSTPHFFFSSWIGFPLYEVDFGCGTPFFATGNFRHEGTPLGYCIILPPRPTSGNTFAATLEIFLMKHVMDALYADPEFLQLFS